MLGLQGCGGSGGGAPTETLDAQQTSTAKAPMALHRVHPALPSKAPARHRDSHLNRHHNEQRCHRTQPNR